MDDIDNSLRNYYNLLPMSTEKCFRQWKVRMRAFMNLIDPFMFERVLEGPITPMIVGENGESRLKTEEELSALERRQIKLGNKAKDIIVLSLGDGMIVDLSCDSPKRMWDSLCVLYDFEGYEQERQHKMSMLSKEYENFRYNYGESLESIFKRYTGLLLKLKTHNMVMCNEDINDKFLRSLPFETSTIMERKRWVKRPLREIYVDLKTFEMPYNPVPTSQGQIASNITEDRDDMEDIDRSFISLFVLLPMCTKKYFEQWKVRMRIFMKPVNSFLFERVLEGPITPMIVGENGESRLKTEEELSARERRQTKLGSMAEFILIFSLDDSMIIDVLHCKSAKEIWDWLSILYEGDEQMRRKKKSMLKREYKNFRYNYKESLESIFKRYTRLLHQMKTHEIVMSNEDINDKFLRSLPRKFATRVDAIMERKRWAKRPLQEIYDNLRTFEMRYNSEKLSEKKNFTLRASSSSGLHGDTSEEDQEEADEDSSDDTDAEIELIIRKIKKLLKKSS